MTKHAILFGINYTETSSARLKGCVNDVLNMKTLLSSDMYMFDDIKVFTDQDRVNRTTACGILQEMNNLASRSWKESLEVAWIHFSGHGCSVRDLTGDEKDGMDECIIPSDFMKSGVVSDDYIRNTLRNFNPKTKVICVFDCCHSGTMGDLKYRYIDTKHPPLVEHDGEPCKSPIIMFSGCKDEQTSADAYNVNNAHKYSGAMTSCLITSLLNLGNRPVEIKIYSLFEELNRTLKSKLFTQIPQLCSSYELKIDETLF
jgi:hypothetical protein